MKTDIHPEYEDSTIVCACGEAIQTKSTKKDYRIEICSKCHPFFTGKQKLVDSAGRVERFQRKYSGQNLSKGKKKSKEKVVEPPQVTETKPKEEESLQA